MKVLTVVGTRPEIIKLSCVLDLLDKTTDHILVHTGQNFDKELNQNFFEDLSLKPPKYYLNASANSAAETIANVIKETDKIIETEKPDAFVIYGDTNSCLSVISAKRKKIPIFHMEAGNRCFDLNVPEEINRKIVDHLSDVNFTLTHQAKNYLLKEGLASEYTILSGSHIPEILEKYKSKISESLILRKLKLDKESYILVSTHREEIVDDDSKLKTFINSLEQVSKKFKKEIIISTHPRTKKRMQKLKIKSNNSRLRFLKPFNFSDYVNLQQNAFCVISDSGTIAEESAILNFSAITIRPTHERPEVYDYGTLLMAELDSKKMIEAIKLAKLLLNKDLDETNIPDYKFRETSKIILNNIFSLTPKINKYIWRK